MFSNLSQVYDGKHTSVNIVSRGWHVYGKDVRKTPKTGEKTNSRK